FVSSIVLVTEYVLRSQIQVKASKPAKNTLTSENTFIGFFNLLEWYQKFILEAINTRIAAKRQKIVRNAVGKIPANLKFSVVCKRVEMNTGALDTEKERKAVKDEIQKQSAQYEKDIIAHGNTTELQERCRQKL